MNTRRALPPQATSNYFAVGLVALKLPVEENGPVARATAFVQFEEDLPVHSVATNVRVFRVAESVFRDAHRFHSADVRIRESFLSRALTEMIEQDGREPDGILDGARVWLAAA